MIEQGFHTATALMAFALLAQLPQEAQAQYCQDFDSMTVGAISSPYSWTWGTGFPPDAVLQIDNGGTSNAEIANSGGGDYVWGSYSTYVGQIQAYRYDTGGYPDALDFDVYLTANMTIQASDSLDNLIYSETINDGGGYWKTANLSDDDGVALVAVDGDSGEVYFNDICFQ